MNLKEQHIGIATNDLVHFLPFWENGVKFFTIEGPNKEKVEFSQYLYCLLYTSPSPRD